MGVRSASANSNSVSHISGGYVSAQWFQSSGCSYSSVYVQAGTNVQATTQTQTGGPTISVYIYGYNYCSGDYFNLSTPWQGVPITGSFDVSRKATDASLNTTVDVNNSACCTYSRVPLKLSLTWTPTSAPAQTKTTTDVSGPGYRTSTTVDGTQANAQATGSISDDKGVDYTLGQPSTAGQIAYVRQGTITHSS